MHPQNAFWEINNSDPHKTCSFDRLHYDLSGLAGKHMRREVTSHILSLGPRAATIVDTQ